MESSGGAVSRCSEHNTGGSRRVSEEEVRKKKRGKGRRKKIKGGRTPGRKEMAGGNKVLKETIEDGSRTEVSQGRETERNKEEQHSDKRGGRASAPAPGVRGERRRASSC